MLQMIIEAIKARQILAFNYNGYNRIVEPHAVGSSRAGNDVLRCYQIQGGHVAAGHNWDLCEISKISNLTLTGNNFASARSDYRRGDKGMLRIYAEL